ncbi:hypothetical protein ACROYT_G019468 [Oculina patagonica]
MASAWTFGTVMVSFLAVVASDPCVPPGDFLKGTSGFFTSPNFPNNFTANSNCTWNITVPTERIIKVTFFNFTLEPNQNPACIGDSQGARVFITNVASDNGKQDFKICGQNLPAPVYSVGNSILVRLRSLSNVYSGFNASYEAIDGGLLCPRGITLTKASGVITSPYYPRLYPDNQNCSWQITAPQGNRVKLEIAITLNIQQCGLQPDCTCDYLQVQNGFSADHNGDDRICGAPGETKTYYSTHESLKVLFVSDVTGSKQYDGFEATYTQLTYSPPICPTKAIPLSGNGKLSSPNYPMSNYPASRNCSWIITVPSCKQVRLSFTELALGSCEHNCSSNNCTHVELYNGASGNSSLLGRFCNGSVLPDVLSSGNQMFVKFRSGSSLDRGFEAQYSVFSDSAPSSTHEVDSSKIETNKVLLILAKKAFLRNGYRTRYVQIIVIQLKDEDQDIGTSTDAKYAAKNINKDYETKEEGEAYITAVFDYGKTEFTIGDEKQYSRSKAGSKKYLNGELESNTHYAVFQRSFDDYGSYDSEKFIRFKTEKSFPTVIVVVVVVVVVVVIIGVGVGIYFYMKRKKKDSYSSPGTEMKGN